MRAGCSVKETKDVGRFGALVGRTPRRAFVMKSWQSGPDLIGFCDRQCVEMITRGAIEKALHPGEWRKVDNRRDDIGKIGGIRGEERATGAVGYICQT